MVTFYRYLPMYLVLLLQTENYILYYTRLRSKSFYSNYPTYILNY